MLDFKIKHIKRDYVKVKNIAIELFKKGNYNESLRFLKIAAEIANNFNFIYKDNEVEELLTHISSKIIEQKKITSPLIHRFVFYDFFGWSNRGLTQQYIRALISWKFEFLYILENNHNNSKNILSEIQAYEKAEIFLIDETLDTVERIKKTYEKISNYRPQKAFLHLSPSDVIAVVVWNALPEIVRYQINLTDHAFWLGTDCIDYVIEFRRYGFTVSNKMRGIPIDRILYQPYYPITECEEYKELPVKIEENNVVMFTGGSYYKMYGGEQIFFKIMHRLLDENPQLIILLAGTGDVKPLEKFIGKNKFETRLLLLGNRSDINHVFKNCDIYLATYPISGGLMAQFAAINGKPILSYTKLDIQSNYLEGLFNLENQINLKITFDKLDEFYEEANMLIYNKPYRISKGEILKEYVIGIKEFNQNLQQIVSTNESIFKDSDLIDINYNALSNLYLEIENSKLDTYKRLILYNFKFSSFFLFPRVVLKSFNSRIFYNLINFSNSYITRMINFYFNLK